MAIESTRFTIDDESAMKIDKGAILELEITVGRVIEYTSTRSKSYQSYHVAFNRDSADDAFRWSNTYRSDNDSAMSDSHVIATREAGSFIEGEYDAEVDLGQLTLP